MNTLLQNMLHCPYIQKCRSLKNAYDYFLHINAPEKYQKYEKDEIIKMNGFVVEPTKFEQGVLYDEVAQKILDYEFTTWTQLFRLYQGQPEYILLLSSRPTMFTKLLDDNWRKQHPDGRTHMVKIVK